MESRFLAHTNTFRESRDVTSRSGTGEESTPAMPKPAVRVQWGTRKLNRACGFLPTTLA